MTQKLVGGLREFPEENQLKQRPTRLRLTDPWIAEPGIPVNPTSTLSATDRLKLPQQLTSIAAVPHCTVRVVSLFVVRQGKQKRTACHVRRLTRNFSTCCRLPGISCDFEKAGCADSAAASVGFRKTCHRDATVAVSLITAAEALAGSSGRIWPAYRA